MLALATAPVAFLAAVRPSFRVAPFTAILVLLVSNEFGEGPLESAFYRVLEVAVGGASAILVSLMVVPESAHALGTEAAARALERLAQALVQLLGRFTRKPDAVALRRIQDDIGAAVAEFQTTVAHAKREPWAYLGSEPDPGPLSRTLLRLRHDLVILGRATTEPLPEAFGARLGPLLARVGDSAGDYLRGSAAALLSHRPPPPLEPVESALQVYTAEIAAVRREGLTRSLASNELEAFFALGFALDQLHRNCLDLERCVNDYAGSSRGRRGRR